MNTLSRMRFGALFAILLFLAGRSAFAANPESGSVAPTGPVLPFTGTFVGTTIGTGVVEDRFKLTVLPGNYTNKVVKVRVHWMVPANDYDLGIFKRLGDGSDGPQVGSSGSGSPLSEEIASIDPNATGTGEYNIVIPYFANTPGVDQPQGEVSVVDIGPPRTATYIKTGHGITFAPNSPVKAGTTIKDGEPSSRLDRFGNYYIGGIRGVPAGVDLWYFDLRPTINGGANPNYDPKMRVPIYRGMPDSAISTANPPVNIGAGALGGGDIDLAVGFGNYTGPDAIVGAEAQPFLAYSSLLAASVTYGRSLDRGATFQFNAAGDAVGGIPVNDRQWMEAFENNTVYLEYREFANALVSVQRSTNGGLTYGNAVPVGFLQQTGSIDVDKFDGTVYISSSEGKVAVSTPATPGGDPGPFTIVQAVHEAVNHNNLFFALKVADGPRDQSGNLTGPGIVYCAYSDGADIYLVHSADKGQTWSKRVSVNDQSDARFKVNLFPWLETGAKPGSVAVAWYGTDNPDNDDNAKWRVYFAQTFNATATAPTFRIAQASDHAIHASNISLGGFGGAANRNLIDYFQISIDPTGAAVIGYTDDHNDFDGNCFVARQITGPSFNGTGSTLLPAVQEGQNLPANPFPPPGAPPVGKIIPQPMQPGLKGEQVTDHVQDQDLALVGVIPGTSPVDIVSIKYQWQDSGGVPFITATMKVSNLASIPPSATWRMYFTANAPETGVIGPTGNKYSKGLSDDGDQYYVQVSTAANGTRSASWGTVARLSDGSLARTPAAGSPERTFINQQDGTISVRISATKLNTAPRKTPAVEHPAIGIGTVLCGLRGEATLSSGSFDGTRGGTEMKIGDAASRAP